jgi:hypothetical protein
MDWSKAAVALIPLGLGALVTIAWQNSHSLVVLSQNVENLRVEVERVKASLEPGRTIQLRQDQAEKELAHLRDLVEQRMVQPRGSDDGRK